MDVFSSFLVKFDLWQKMRDLRSLVKRKAVALVAGPLVIFARDRLISSVVIVVETSRSLVHIYRGYVSQKCHDERTKG